MASSDSDSRLLAQLDTELPSRLSADRANQIFVAGSCSHPVRRLKALAIEIDGRLNPVTAHSIPRPDLAANGKDDHAYRGGFWGIATLPASDRFRTIGVELVARLDDGTRSRAPVGSIELSGPRPRRHHENDSARTAAARPRIAICMATYEPPLDLLEQQIESIRQQTNRDWVCLISDDSSSPESFAALEAMVGDDPRFIVSHADLRAGFFHNFERALRLAPPEAEFIALADQDDRWHRDKLDALVDAIGSASIAYSDARVIDHVGRLISPTYWTRRRNNSTDLISMLLANTVSGSAALFRRRVVDLALPFPPAFGGLYHDHWMALVGLAIGKVAYIDRPLYDYVQHDDAVLGHERGQAWALSGRHLRERLRHFGADPEYFYDHWRTTYFQEYCRVALMARLLLARCGSGLSEGRRRGLKRLSDAERSPAAIAWLATRQLRRLVGLSETVGAEGRLLRAFAWRRLLAAQPASKRAARAWLPRHGAFPSDRVGTTIEPPVPAPPP